MDSVTHRSLSPGIRFHNKVGTKTLSNAISAQPLSIYELNQWTPDTEQPCPLCGQNGLVYQEVLWPTLISAWQLSEEETALINRQQGEQCAHCHANLRSRTLAGALCECLNWPGSLQHLISTAARTLPALLEINEAGHCHTWLQQWPAYTFAAYPKIDMQAMPYADGQFDMIIHSDTLEHVPDPIKALRECRRILTDKGIVLMTIPIVPTRLTRRRMGLPPSYHGQAGHEQGDMEVITEYGADFYLELLLAGWSKVSLYTLGTPASIAVIGIK